MATNGTTQMPEGLKSAGRNALQPTPSCMHAAIDAGHSAHLDPSLDQATIAAHVATCEHCQRSLVGASGSN